MAGADKRQRGKIFYGWYIIFFGALIIAVGSGILYHGFTVFFLPLKRDLAVSSAAISLLYGAARLEGGAEGPLVGYLIDRFGPRALILCGVTLSGLGLILLSTVHSFLGFFLIYIFIVSLGFNAGFFHPVYAAINSWFIRRRGVGFAIIGSASSIGGMLMAPFLSYLILNFGWRTSAILAGTLILAVALPSGLRIYRNPETLGLLPDGKDPAEETHQKGKERKKIENKDFSVKEALHTFVFWLLFLAITLRIFVTVALTIHFVPLYVWKGLSEGFSAYLVSLFASATIGTTLLCGWLGDRWGKALLCSVGIIPTIVGMFSLIFFTTWPYLYILPIGLAITMGTVPLNWALIGDFFGRKSFGTLRGIMGIGNGLGTFFSPIYAGWVFDSTGSYSPALRTFLIIHLLAAFLFGILHVHSLRNKP